MKRRLWKPLRVLFSLPSAAAYLPYLPCCAARLLSLSLPYCALLCLLAAVVVQTCPVVNSLVPYCCPTVSLLLPYCLGQARCAIL